MVHPTPPLRRILRCGSGAGQFDSWPRAQAPLLPVALEALWWDCQRFFAPLHAGEPPSRKAPANGSRRRRRTQRHHEACSPATAACTRQREDGTPGVIRTPDPLLRRQVLYPAELRAHSKWHRHSYLCPHQPRHRQECLCHFIHCATRAAVCQSRIRPNWDSLPQRVLEKLNRALSP